MANRNCILCYRESTESTIVLECGHYFCSLNCIQVLIEDQLGGNLGKYDSLKCQCGEKFPTKCIKAAYGGEEKFREILNEVCRRFEPQLECPICFDNLPASDFITLGCEHRYCVNCLKLSTKLLLQDGHYFEDIKCYKCAHVIDPYIILALIDSETKQQYENFLLEKFSAEPKTMYVRCIGRPGINCKFGMFIPVDQEVFNCEVCNASFCPKCKNKPHPTITCEQMCISDPYFKSQIDAMIMKPCPWCNYPVFEKKTCKYITCNSEQCQGKNSFCWDCGIKLSEMHSCDTNEVLIHRYRTLFRNIF